MHAHLASLFPDFDAKRILEWTELLEQEGLTKVSDLRGHARLFDMLFVMCIIIRFCFTDMAADDWQTLAGKCPVMLINKLRENTNVPTELAGKKCFLFWDIENCSIPGKYYS